MGQSILFLNFIVFVCEFLYYGYRVYRFISMRGTIIKKNSDYHYKRQSLDIK